MAMIFTDGSAASTCNTSPATGAEATFTLISLLLNAGWTHWASSDGISVSTPSIGSNTPATPNRITNFNNVAATAGSIHNASAWIVLRDPTSKRLLGIQHSSTQSVHRDWKVKYVPHLAGVVPNVFTAGTTTQMPLFADASDNGSKYMLGSTITTFQTWWSSSAFRHSCGADNATGSFFSIRWNVTTGSANSVGALMMDVLSPNTFPTEDDDPVVWYGPDTSIGTVFLAASGLASASDTPGVGSIQGYLRHGMSQERWAGIAAMSYVGFSSVAQVIIPGNLGVNPHTDQEDGAPIFYARGGSIAWPGGWKGGSSLMRWNGTARTTGQALTSGATRDRITISDVNFPWNGSVPLI